MHRASVRTRCRVDLAGGTLDIWPLGVLHEGARTVNVAIDLDVEVDLEPRRAGYRIEAGSEAAAVEATTLAELATHPDLRLVTLVLSWLQLPALELRLRTRSPRGAGLGGSSAVTVALLAAGWRATGQVLPPPEKTAAIARDLEARLMQLPTGMQDHLPALLGGALEVLQSPGGAQVTKLPVNLELLGECLHVVYTGVSHFSAGANWGIVRRRLEGDPDVVDRLARIAEAATEMRAALEGADLERCGRLLSAEWEARRGLAPGVSTPEVELLIDSAKGAGAWGGKACGAGGGGCVALLAPPEARSRIRDACLAAGGTIIETKPTAVGLELLR